MLQLTATPDVVDSTVTITIEGLPKLSIAEIRSQNTMSGVTDVILIDVDKDGKAIYTRTEFSQAIVTTVRILDDSNDTQLHKFLFSERVADQLVFVSNSAITESKPQSLGIVPNVGGTNDDQRPTFPKGVTTNV